MDKQFEKYQEEAYKGWKEFRYRNYPNAGEMIGSTNPSQEERNRFYELYMDYRIDKTNKRLVWATWALAIGTIILSILTLLLK